MESIRARKNLVGTGSVADRLRPPQLTHLTLVLSSASHGWDGVVMGLIQGEIPDFTRILPVGNVVTVNLQGVVPVERRIGKRYCARACGRSAVTISRDGQEMDYRT